MSSKFLQGAIIITLATIVSKIVGSIFRIPLNIAGDEVLGIFTIVYPVYMSVLILTVAGIPLAISKLISEARVHDRQEDIQAIYNTSRILALSFGVISFALIVLFADKIALLLGGSFAYYAIIVVSITLLVAPYMAVYRGFFQGYENMRPTAVSQVLEQLVRVFVIILAAYVLTAQQKPVDIVAAGVMFGSIIGVIAALIYLKRLYHKKHIREKKASYTFAHFTEWSKKILKISLPICIGALTMAFLTMVDSVTVPIQLVANGFSEAEVTYLYGIYGRGLALVQIAVVFASSLILPLIPLITSFMTKGEKLDTQAALEKATKYTHLTTWPAVVGLVVLTLPVNLALFTDLQGNLIIAILSFSALFTAFSVLTTGILQGMDKAAHAAIFVLVCALVKVVLNLILVSSYGVLGAAISTVATYFLLVVGNMIMIYRVVPFRLLGRDGVSIVFASIVMGVVVGAPLYFFSLEEWTRGHALLYLIVMILVGAIVYIGIVAMTKAVKKEEIRSLPIIGKMIR